MYLHTYVYAYVCYLRACVRLEPGFHALDDASFRTVIRVAVAARETPEK